MECRKSAVRSAGNKHSVMLKKAVHNSNNNKYINNNYNGYQGKKSGYKGKHIHLDI